LRYDAERSSDTDSPRITTTTIYGHGKPKTGRPPQKSKNHNRRSRQVADSHTQFDKVVRSVDKTKILKKQETLTIPVNRIDEGLRDIAKNIRRFAKDADILLESGSDWHAIALAIFAFEELGKYHALKEAKRAAKGDIVTIDEALFRKHDHKQNIAKSLLSREALTILPRVVLSNVDDLSPSIMIHSVKVSPLLRLDCLFVDWENGEWKLGSPEDPKHVKEFVQAIVGALVKMETRPP